MRYLFLASATFLFFLFALPPAHSSDKELTDENLARWTQEAESGDVNALFMLGYAYLWNESPYSNVEKGLEIWRLAAEKGNPAAQHNLGSFYIDGIIVEKDITKSTQYYLMVAKQKQSLSQYYLVENYLEMKMYGEAYVWSYVITQGAENELQEEAKNHMNEIEKILSQKELKAAQSKAQRFSELYSSQK